MRIRKMQSDPECILFGESQRPNPVSQIGLILHKHVQVAHVDFCIGCLRHANTVMGRCNEQSPPKNPKILCLIPFADMVHQRWTHKSTSWFSRSRRTGKAPTAVCSNLRLSRSLGPIYMPLYSSVKESYRELHWATKENVSVSCWLAFTGISSSLSRAQYRWWFTNCFSSNCVVILKKAY